MTGQRPLAVIHTRRGATGLEAQNHQVACSFWWHCHAHCWKQRSSERDFCLVFCRGGGSADTFWMADLNKANYQQNVFLGILSKSPEMCRTNTQCIERKLVKLSLHLLMHYCWTYLSLPPPLPRLSTVRSLPANLSMCGRLRSTVCCLQRTCEFTSNKCALYWHF